MGNNDPVEGGNGDGSGAPFAGELTFFSYSKTPTVFGLDAVPAYSIDGFSTTVDRDKIRRRYGMVFDETTVNSIDNLYKRMIRQDDFALMGNESPIVSSWRSTTNAVRAVNIYGDVLQMNGGSSGWDLVTNLLGTNLTVLANVREVQTKAPVKFVKQSATGMLFGVVLDIANSNVVIKKSEDNGTTWTDAFTPVQPATAKFLDYTNWDSDYVTIIDSMIHTGKLWVLTGYDDGVDAYPSIESFDLTTGDQATFDLNDSLVKAKNTQVEFDHSPQYTTWALTTPATDLEATPRATALTLLKGSIRYTVVEYVFNGTGYDAEVITNSGLSKFTLNKEFKFITSYSIPLQKNANYFLDVVEIGCMVEDDEVGFETYLNHQERTQSGFLSYGVKVLTSVRSPAGRNNWAESDIALGAGNPHSKIVVESPTRRMHYIMQPENVIGRIRFTEDNDISGFRALLDSSILLEKHPGYRQLSTTACGVYSLPTVLETQNSSYVFDVYSNEEVNKTDINYSFIGTNALGKIKWLVSDIINTPLQERVFGEEYAFIGKIPLVVGASGDNLFAWSDIETGLFKSTDGGNSWNYFMETEVFYNQNQSDKPERNIIGSATIKMLPGNFIGGSLVGDNLIFDVKMLGSIEVVDIVANDLQADMALDSRMLFTSRQGPYSFADRGYAEQTQYGGFGINVLGAYAPKKLVTWDVDDTNTVTTYSKYTTDNAQPFAEEFGRTNYSANISSNFNVLDIQHNVKFLDIDHVVYGYENIAGTDVYSLKIVDNLDVVTNHDLFGGTNPALVGFKPEATIYLWEYQETNYVPIIYYHDKKMILLNRLKEDGEFDITIHLVNIPSDNGGQVKLIPLFSNNRRDFYLTQVGNGIFKFNYVYNTVTKAATITLVRMFNLNGALSDVTLISGAVRGLTTVTAPTAPLIPTFPANGTLLNTVCSGTTKVGVYADGVGGTYNQDIEVNSVDCGYVDPGPAPVGATNTDVILNTTSATADLLETLVNTGEDGTAYAVYELSDVLLNNTDLVLDVNYVTASAGDIASIEYRIGDGTFSAATLPQTITIPAGETELVVRINYAEDLTTEGTETFELVLDKAVGNTQITNASALVTTITITDTSTGAAPGTTLVPDTFDPLISGNDAIFTNGNLTYEGYITSTALSATSVSTGNYFVEVTIDNLFYGPYIGIATAATDVNTHIGQDTNSFGIYGNNGNFVFDGLYSAMGPALALNDVVGMFINTSAKTVEFFVNGVSIGTHTHTITDPLFVAVSGSGSDSTDTETVTANFGATAFAYPANAVGSVGGFGIMV